MDGIERIKVLASEVTNKSVLKIVEYLTSRKDMNDKYLNEEKSLKQMISYIKSKAQKQQEDGCAMLEDEEVYSLAIHYWDESNKDLGFKSEKELRKEAEERRKHNAEQIELRKQQLKEKRASKKKEKEQVKDDSKSISEELKPKWIPEGQLSLF